MKTCSFLPIFLCPFRLSFPVFIRFFNPSLDKSLTLLCNHRGPNGKMEVYIHVFLNSEWDGGSWSISRPGCVLYDSFWWKICGWRKFALRWILRTTHRTISIKGDFGEKSVVPMVHYAYSPDLTLLLRLPYYVDSFKGIRFWRCGIDWEGYDRPSKQTVVPWKCFDRWKRLGSRVHLQEKLIPRKSQQFTRSFNTKLLVWILVIQFQTQYTRILAQRSVRYFWKDYLYDRHNKWNL